MKIPSLLVYCKSLKIALLALAFCFQAEKSFSMEKLFLPDGVSCLRRGVLSFGESDLAITSYISVKQNKALMLLKSPAGTLAKIEISKGGEILVCEGGTFFPKTFAEKFAARDFMLILGFTKILDSKKTKFKRDEFGRIILLSECEYEIKFSGYEKIKELNFFIPAKIEITDKNYKLELGAVHILKMPQEK